MKMCESTETESFVRQLQNCGSQDQLELLEKLSHSLLTNRSEEYPDKNVSDYCSVLTFLLDALKPSLCNSKQQEELLIKFFLEGSHHDSFIILVQRFSLCSPSFQQSKILDILEKFLRTGNVYFMMLNQCCDNNGEKLRVIADSVYWENITTFLVSLPERVANQVKAKYKNIFHTSNYIPLLASSIWRVLCTVYENMQAGKDCNLLFLGKITGRLCSAGYGGVVAKYIILQLLKHSKSDFLWRRISHNFHTKIPPSSIESYLSHGLSHVPWYGYMENIFGNLVVSNQKIQFLLTVKFLLIRQFNEVAILKNVIGYIATQTHSKELFTKVVKSLLSVWADESAFRHQNSSQQYYLASGLMICSGHLKDINDIPNNRELINSSLAGIQLRIGSSEALIRSIGMMVGDALVSALDSDAPKMEFEHDLSDPEMKQLQELKIVPKEPDSTISDKYTEEIESFACFDDVAEPKAVASAVESLAPAEEIDSDDDLEPYDMSNDLPNESRNHPFYLRDCLQGLIEAEKPEWTEQCLRYVPELVRLNPNETTEVAAEMAKVLLHLEDTFGMSDFLVARHRALIAVTVECPAKVAPYLTSQFYERDFNIRQRLDILEVVAAASKALSQPDIAVLKNSESLVVSEKAVEDDWRTVLDKRLQAKTRYFSLVPRRKAPEPQLNLFGAVAGHFFFPLIEKFDRENKMLRLMGDDSYVLGRLLYTLGIVMHSSTNTPICRQMGSELLQFVTVVGNHSEAYVRKAAIFAVTSVFLSVPPFLLLSEMQEKVLNCHQWLNAIVDRDNDADCQVKAAQASQLLLKHIEEELPSSIQTT